MFPIRSALRSATRYVVRNPTSMYRMARHAMKLRVAVPLDAIRWFVASMPPKKSAPQDVVITARPPAVHLAASVDLMGTKVRASTSIAIEELRVHADELRVELRLDDTEMRVLDRSETPVATLIRSGALDLSRPGNLAKFMPKRPAALVEAHDNILVVDLMKVPALANNGRLRMILSRLTPVVNVTALRTEGDFLILALRAAPDGFPRALAAATGN